MRSLLIIFAILLVILTLISSLGGSLNSKEHFYVSNEQEPEIEAFDEETPKLEEFYNETPETPQMPQIPVKAQESEPFYNPPSTDDMNNIEPFEPVDSMHASF